MTVALGAYSARGRLALSATSLKVGQNLTDTVTSKSGVRVRPSDERWAHITEEHCELVGLHPAVLETIGNPLRILAGGAGELLAVSEVDARLLPRLCFQ